MGDVSLEMQKEMLSSLEKINTSITKNNDLLSNAQEITKDMNKNYDKMVDSYDDLEKGQKKHNKQMDIASGILEGMVEIGRRLKNLFFQIFGLTAIISFIKGVFELNSKLRDTAFRMGQGAKGLHEMQGAMTELKMATGASNEAAGELLMNIVRITGTTKDLAKLSIAAERFARVTGVTNEDAARLSGELTRMGRLGADQVGRVELTMMNVQRAVGLTESEMQSLTQTTIKATKILGQMGRSAADVERFSKGTAKLVGAFRSVGVEAGEALKIVEELLDPTKIEDNALLYSKLGISMSDAINGSVDPGALIDKFQGLGQEMRGMNRIAAGELSKQMGMSLDMIGQFADIDREKFSAAMDANGGDWQKAMASMESEQTGPMEKLQRMFTSLLSTLDPIINVVEEVLNKGLGKIQENIPKITAFIKENLMPFFKKLADPKAFIAIGIGLIAALILIKTLVGKLFSPKGGIGETISSGVRGSIEMGYDKGSKAAIEKSGKFERIMSEDRKKRIMDSWDFQHRQAQAFTLKQEASSGRFFKGIIGWGAKMAEVASYAAKPELGLLGWTKGVNAKIIERANLYKINNRLITEGKEKTLESYSTEKKSLQDRLMQLRMLGDGADARQQSELRALEARDSKLDKLMTKEINGIERIKGSASRGHDALMKWASKEDLAIMAQQVEAAKEMVRKNQESIVQRDFINQQELKITQEINKQYRSEKDMLGDKIKSGLATREERSAFEDITKKLRESEDVEKRLLTENEAITAEIKQQKDKMAELDAEAIDVAKHAEGFNLKAVDVGKLKGFERIWYKAGDAVKAIGRNIGSAATNFALKIKDGAVGAAKALVGGLLKAPGYLKALGGGSGPLALLKGVGKFAVGKRMDAEGKETTSKGAGVMGGIFGLLMGLAPIQKLIAGLMTSLKKPLEGLMPVINNMLATLSPIIEQIGQVISDLLRDLMPILMPLIKIFLDLIMSLLKPILPIVLGILKKAIPIIAFVLGLILTAIGGVIWAVGQVVKALGGGSAMVNMGKGMMETGTALMFMKEDTAITAEASQETADETKKANEEKPAVITARDKTFVTTSSASVNSSEDTVAANSSAQTQIQSEQVAVAKDQSKVAEVTATATTEMVTLLRELNTNISNFVNLAKAQSTVINDRNLS